VRDRSGYGYREAQRRSRTPSRGETWPRSPRSERGQGTHRVAKPKPRLVLGDVSKLRTFRVVQSGLKSTLLMSKVEYNPFRASPTLPGGCRSGRPCQENGARRRPATGR
jgi:hypothetical protein